MDEISIPLSSTSDPENDAGKPTNEMKADLPSRSQSPTKSPLQALATHGEADEAEKEESELEEEVPSQNGHPQLVLAPADGNILMNAIKRMDRKGWSLEENEHFVLALQMLGSDFCLMAKVGGFPGRERKHLKSKFKRELKINPDWLQIIMQNREPFDLEKLQAGPRRIENADIAPQMEPSPTKNLGTATLKKKAAKKWKREKKATAVKRKAADTEQMESTTPGPAEKKLIIGQTPAEFLALKADPIIIPRICNIVCSFTVGHDIDLKKVMLKVLKADYDPCFPSFVTLYLENPNTSARLYKNGEVSCAGATSLEAARQATRIYARMIQESGFPQVKYLNFSVNNIKATYTVDFFIDVKKLVASNRQCCRYELEESPAAMWRMEEPKVAFIIFASGKINLSGGKTMRNVSDAFEKIFKIVQKYKKG